MKAHDNPFASHRIDALEYRLCGESWNSLLQRLESLSYRAAIVGPHGHGKTTLIEEIAGRLSNHGRTVHWLRLRRDATGKLERPDPFPGRALGPSDIAVIDGADLLPIWRWYWLRWRMRRAAGLLVTTHGEGWLPTLFACRTSPELLGQLVSQLLGESAASPAAEFLPGEAELYRRHAGNLRSALRELYDRWAAHGEENADKR